MSILRDLGVFLLSIFFTMSLISAVYSYTLGELIQRDNFENFMKSELAPDLVEDQCSNLCSDYEDLEMCTNACMEQVTNDTEKNIENTITGIYEKDVFYGYTIEDVAPLFAKVNFIFFLIAAFVFGSLLMLISENPLSNMGKSLIMISTALFVLSFIIDFMVPVSNEPYELISGYLGHSVEQEITLIATIMFAAGVVLVVANYFLERSKKRKPKRKKK